ncbi:GNAT family N-acetyltransferase [Methanocalculus sp.]|uniref:GNAT family N-acetyltransferase n=1 Tax=Methanocalculus sp. TaxID=2004547 RepID=UPI0027171600|nr:GNAT family N-acetyltransferase [Methanocalculus sp.]MDO8842291.1 GNAT family N-acetyltransferase [Methanocalculus sp.]
MVQPFQTPIRTDRLHLIPATIEMLKSEQGDRQALSTLLRAYVPGAWPPPLLDEETLSSFILMIEEERDPYFTCWYWIRDDRSKGRRTLIGSGGIASSPVSGDSIVIGYSVLEEYRCLGYATEAVKGLIPGIFSLIGIEQIIATTYPDMIASIRVLEKNGFMNAGEVARGEGIEEGTLLYLLKKPDIQI